MNLKEKILSVLKEDEENLFKPRKVSEREEILKKEEEEILKKYPGIKDVYLVHLTFKLFNFEYYIDHFVRAKDYQDALDKIKSIALNNARTYFIKKFNSLSDSDLDKIWMSGRSVVNIYQPIAGGYRREVFLQEPDLLKLFNHNLPYIKFDV